MRLIGIRYLLSISITGPLLTLLNRCTVLTVTALV